MPQRFLRPGITNSERWNSVSWPAQSLFVRLLTIVDDFGRCDGRVPIIWAACYTIWNSCCKLQRNSVSLQQVEEMLQQLAATFLIQRYDDPETGKPVVQIVQWQERIRAGVKEKWPGPPKPPQKLLQLSGELQQVAQKLQRSSTRTIDQKLEPPPTVPQGGQASEPNASSEAVIEKTEEAIRLICQHIFPGKDPRRPWGSEALHELARQLPIPLREIKLIGRAHKLAKSTDPEGKTFRPRQSETTLASNWSDEVTRSSEFLKKINAGSLENPAAAVKKEPALWREFFRWKYGADITLPDQFILLGADQRREWDDGGAVFAESIAKKQPAGAGV